MRDTKTQVLEKAKETVLNVYLLTETLNMVMHFM